MAIGELSPITPVNFFQYSVTASYLAAKGDFPRLNEKNMDHYLLPHLGMCHEERFAKVAMGWNKEGLELLFVVNKSIETVHYPQIDKGDSIELFIDTRDVKTSGYNTRFCHHFYFLPEPVEGIQKGEKTHFRTEDTHEWCDPDDLKVKVKVKKGSYSLHCLIPANCLNGYDPSQFKKLGFTYRINRPYWQSQHFSVTSEDYQFEQLPSLWSSVELIKMGGAT